MFERIGDGKKLSGKQGKSDRKISLLEKRGYCDRDEK